MNRNDLAFLVSRALAVWTVGAAFHRIIVNLVTVMNTPLGRGRQLTLGELPGFLVWLVIGLFLWFRAGSFGTWAGSEPSMSPSEPVVDKKSVAMGLLQAVALYWTVIAIVEILTYVSRMVLDPILGKYDYPRDMTNVLGYTILAALSIVLLICSRKVAVFLCSM